MRLRNKKIKVGDNYNLLFKYNSIAKLNEQLKDYRSKEPLIKDKNIRKALIAWAKANSQRTSVVYQRIDESNSCISFIDFGGLIIEFNKTIDELTGGRIYKFEELCGSEE